MYKNWEQLFEDIVLGILGIAKKVFFCFFSHKISAKGIFLME